MDPDRLQRILDGFPRRRVAVVGDFFLDKYLDVDASLAEVSLETGKTAHQVVAVRHSPGAAGTVAANLSALGAGEIHAIGFTGDDGEGHDLRAGLRRLGCRLEGLQRVRGRMTPAYLKPRDPAAPGVAGERERYDLKNRAPTPAAVAERVIRDLDRLLPRLDAVAVLDQVEEENCGGVTAWVREQLAVRSAASAGARIFWADSRRRIGAFRGMLLKPNLAEAARAVRGDAADPGGVLPPEEWADLASALRNGAGAPVCITCGARGAMVCADGPVLVPAVRIEGPIDPTGAGDSVTAAAILALASGSDLREAALFGMLAASVTVRQLGATGTARPDQIRASLDLWRSQQENAT